MTRQLVIATRNRKKVLELSRLLADVPIELLSLETFEQAGDVEESGETFEANAILKAVAGAQATGHWTLADDSGLEVDALGGLPGVRSARFAGEKAGDAENRLRLLSALQGVPADRRAARFVCVLALCSPTLDLELTRGTCEGRILEEERGSGGFGYDPLFEVAGSHLTMAELSADEKNRVSHRGRALELLRKRLLELCG
jgi:XTP/dITP diphosphohydrolase